MSHIYIHICAKGKKVLTHFDVYWKFTLLGPHTNTDTPGSTKLPFLQYTGIRVNSNE